VNILDCFAINRMLKESLSKVWMVDEMRGGSRRIADGNPAVAQGANDESFQDSSGS
jgi:hypothetical protein